MEGEVGPQVAVYDSFSCGSPPFFQYQFLPGKGCEGVYGAKQAALSQAALSGRLNLNFDSSCSPTKEQRFRPVDNGGGSSGHWNSWNWDGFSFSAQPNPETGSHAGEPVKSRESEGVEKINPSDLRLDSRGLSGVAAADSRNIIDLGITEQKRKQSLFSNGSPSPQISSMNGEDSFAEDAGGLSLKLCPGTYSYTEDMGNSSRNCKRYRSSSPGSQSPTCQVDDCRADLKHAKDYHRRHKVCEMHSKAPQSLVHGLMQRFCQQCSRFHPLQEFDEGKRSCRRRLAGHNKRRRKPHPDVTTTGVPLSDAVRGSELLSLVAILSQIQSASALEKLDGPSKDQEAILQGLKKANSFLPMSAALSRDTVPVACALNAVRQTPAQTLPGVQRSDQESSAGLLTALASLSPEALSVVLRNSLRAQVSPSQGKVQEAQLSQQLQCVDQSSRPLFSSGLRSSDELSKASDRISEHPNTRCALPFSLSENAIRPNGCQDHTDWSSRPSITRQYLVPDSSHRVEGDSRPVHASKWAGPPPAEKNFFPTQSGSGIRNETASRMNDAVLNSESNMARHLTTEASDHQTLRQEITFEGRNIDSRKPSQQMSESSESGSDQSPASSSSDWQERTGRIIFKLFDKKNPGDFPQGLRAQILEWLAHTPSEMESYIRPGCVLLTIFLTMRHHNWEELVTNLQGSLERLLRYSHGDLWTKGRILVQVEQQRVLIVDGKIRKIRCLRLMNNPTLKSVRPLAIVAGEETTLVVRGQNLVPQAKIVCVYHGKYFLQEVPCVEIKDVHADSNSGSAEREENHDKQVQRIDFTGGPRNVLGRCFIEVEHNLLGNILPVIVADDAICTELRTLEQELDSTFPRKSNYGDEFSSDEFNLNKEAEAMSFLHELGWLFQRSCWSTSALACLEMAPSSQFRLSRFKGLLKYAVLHDWCAVVKKLLDMLFSIGVNENDGSFQEVLQMLSEVNLVHQAVKRKCRLMVELLLQYIPGGNGLKCKNIFSPSMVGPAGLTPLHIAASISNAEEIVDALTNDPCEVGLNAWKDAFDDSGRTPEWHALHSGNPSYIRLVEKKLTSKRTHYVSITIGDMPKEAARDKDLTCARTREAVDLKKLQIELPRFLRNIQHPPAHSCRDCKTGLRLHNRARISGINGRMHRPLIMALVAVATVCASVALLMQGPPHLDSIYYSLKWDGILYGFL